MTHNSCDILRKNRSPSPDYRVPPINLDELPEFLLCKKAFVQCADGTFAENFVALLTLCFSICSYNTKVWWMPWIYLRSFYTQGVGSDVARQMFAMQRVSFAAKRKVFYSKRSIILQRRLFQVSINARAAPLRLIKYAVESLKNHLFHLLFSFLLLVQQTIWYKMCIMWFRYTAHASGPKGTGQCLPPAMLRVLTVLATAKHGRRILFDGRQEAHVQTGLWGSQSQRWEFWS